MHVQITVKNYRCFPDSRPLRFEVKNGFIAFVGTNNSGKSSILKFFYEFRQLFHGLANPDSLAQVLNAGVISFQYPQSVKDPEEVFCDFNSRDLGIEFVMLGEQASRHRLIRLTLVVARGSNSVRHLEVQTENGTFTTQNQTPGGFDRAGSDRIRATQSGEIIQLDNFMLVVRELADTLYIGAFRNAINVGTEAYFDIAVGQGFITVWREYKSGDLRKQNMLAKQITDDISRVFGVDLEINPSPNSQTLKLMIDGRSYKLDDVGAGMAQFIVVLASVAMRNPAFVLIDEPELNLHPSLQISFVTTLASYAKRGVLFSTHSIGLARAVADQQYAVRRIARGESEVRHLGDAPRYAEFLGELSFNGYQELGFDQILLVEGSTEVRTIQQFLKQLGVDHQIVLLPLGGSGMINGAREQELLEIKRISHNVSALIDSEKSCEDAPLQESRAAFVTSCEKARIQCHVLQRRAIENYFTDGAIKEEKGQKYSALGPFEKLENSKLPWAKAENWRIAKHMSLKDLENTDLLDFLKTLKQ
jgi:predicted ATPase